MSKDLVIVESPAKAKTIQKFLGKDYIIKSCNGHIRDLSPNKLSINVDKNFEPEYHIMEDKEKLVGELKECVKKSNLVWLATDEDREGEAISWHLANVLELDKDRTRRIVFHEITNKAIQEAIKNPREVNQSLVDAQQARRILDRLVGFKVSPILWQKVKPALSAGRVQSVAVRLIVEREREIIHFMTKPFFRVTAEFYCKSESKSDTPIYGELSRKFDDFESSRLFLEDCIDSAFTVESIETKSLKKYPAPPFTTSTLQQEAYRKLGYSVTQTMRLAQTLYEEGHITYMRTDSVKLSTLAIDAAKKEITKLFGKEYSHPRNFETKSKSAQEAHEAIRPTNIDIQKPGMNSQEEKLYELIWKRAVASQMSEAEVEKTNIKILISKNPNHFISTGEVIKFDGFLKLYSESTDDDNAESGNNIIPPVYKGERLDMAVCQASEKYTRPPVRYSEASLVKKMEELGIGRPSTYAPTISTILKREYVIKDTKPGKDRKVRVLKLQKGQISEETKTENTGGDKSKFFPSNIGIIVNDFLIKNMDKILDYHFTANIEDDFDNIAEGKLSWQKMISDFYIDFEQALVKTMESESKPHIERLLGIDPKTQQNVYVRLGKFGAYVQVGDKTPEQKPKYANLKKDQLFENISLEEALELVILPRLLGDYQSLPVLVNIGKWGPYVSYNKAFCSIPKEEDPYSIDINRAIEIINAKKDQQKDNIIKTLENKGKPILVLKGKYGPYLYFMKKSYHIPKEITPETITQEKALEIIDEINKNPKPKRKFRKFVKK